MAWKPTRTRGIQRDTKTGRYRVRWTDENTREHKQWMAPEATLEQAEEFLRDVKVRITRIKHGLEVRSRNPQSLTLGKVAKRWLKHKGKDNRLESAVTAHIIEQPIGALSLDKVTRDVIATHLDELKPAPRKDIKKVKAELSPRTKNHIRKHLLQIFKFAIERGLYLGENPVVAVEPRAVKRKPLNVLTLPELVRLVQVAEPPARGMIATAAHGLRKGEIIGLNVEDVDLDRDEFHVRRSHDKDLTKNGRERVVPFIPGLRHVIVEAVGLVGQTGPLFPGRADGREDGRRNDRASFEVWFRRALGLAGVTRHIRFHDMRHTAATLLLQAGAPIAHVSRILGHSSIAITSDVYGHIAVADLHSAMRTLPIPEPPKQLPAPEVLEP